MDHLPRPRPQPGEAGTLHVVARTYLTLLIDLPLSNHHHPPTHRPPILTHVALYCVYIVDDLFFCDPTDIYRRRLPSQPHTVAPDALFCSLSIPSKAASLPHTHTHTQTHTRT